MTICYIRNCDVCKCHLCVKDVDMRIVKWKWAFYWTKAILFQSYYVCVNINDLIWPLQLSC